MTRIPHLSRFFSALSWILNFRKPSFARIDYIDVVLEQHALLLLSWETANASAIRIPAARAVYRLETSAVVCRLPEGTESVELLLRNCWRRSRVCIPLRRLSLEKDVAETLERLGQLNPFVVRLLAPSIPHFQFWPTLPQLAFSTACNVKIASIHINRQQLNDYAP